MLISRLSTRVLCSFLFAISCVFVSTAVAQPSATSANIQTEKEWNASLESVYSLDDLPLYSMQYYGDYDLDYEFQDSDIDVDQASNASGTPASWACSLFVAHGDGKQVVYGRNFDWYDHPAIILSTDPPNGYASISMVDVSYLGYDLDDEKFNSKEGRKALLLAPLLPFDGMNEKGLTVGMAAVGDTVMPRDENKPNTGGLRIIRRMLDQAADVDEALEIFEQYNIVFEGGPHIHYLISDAKGHSALIELLDGKTSIHRNKANWQTATNFYYTGNEDDACEHCHRFATIDRRMTDKDGSLTVEEAFGLLKDVAQGNTRWSMVYETVNGKIGGPQVKAHVATKRRFDHVHAYWNNRSSTDSGHFFNGGPPVEVEDR